MASALPAAAKRAKKDRNNNVDYERYIFAGNIPKTCSKDQLRTALSEIGEVDDISMHDKDPQDEHVAKFAFVSFSNPSDRNKAIDLDGEIFIDDNPIHIEERKPKEDAFPDPPLEFWRSMLKEFKWRKSAAVYVFRHRTMEDYLSEYLHTFACIRRVNSDNIENLSHLLTTMCETEPLDGLRQVLPPHLSGMIVNMKSRHKKKWELKGLRAVVSERPELFLLMDNDIKYVGSWMKLQEAIDHLREMVVEGLFIYFLAKFSHGVPFDIKFSFYAKSEPIKTVLSTLTGYYSAARALEYYFNVMNEVFHYDQDDRKLYLLVDYFHGSSLRDLKPFLPDEFQQIFTGIGKVVALDNAKATVEFRYEKKFIKRAQLYKENCHCPLPEIGVGVSVNFTAILDQSVMVWCCTSAWIPGKPYLNLKGKINSLQGDKGTVICVGPDGKEVKASFNRKDLLCREVHKNLKVYVDIEPTDDNDFKATLLWTGERPDEKVILQNQYKLEIDEVFKYLNRKPAKYEFPKGTPSVVQSTLSEIVDDPDVLKFDYRFINVDFFEFVFSNLIPISKLKEFDEKKNQVLLKLEEETKNALAGILAEFVLKK